MGRRTKHKQTEAEFTDGQLHAQTDDVHEKIAELPSNVCQTAIGQPW